jgi:hypothetical protein
MRHPAIERTFREQLLVRARGRDAAPGTRIRSASRVPEFAPGMGICQWFHFEDHRLDDAVCWLRRWGVRHAGSTRTTRARRNASRRSPSSAAGWCDGMAPENLTLCILWNTRVIPGARPFDPYPFGFLTMSVSYEAAGVSIFVLLRKTG